MKKWKAYIPWHCTVKLEVEADTQEEAEELAGREAHGSVCVHCSKHIEMGETNDTEPVEVVEVSQ